MELSEALHGILRRAMACVPGAERGWLLTLEGGQPVMRASWGHEGPLSDPLLCPPAADRFRQLFSELITPLFPVRAVPATTWHGDPSEVGRPGVDKRLPREAEVLVSAFCVRGAPRGCLAIERPGAAELERERRVVLEVLADEAGSLLERRLVEDERARALRELRLLEEILGAIAASRDPLQLLDTLAEGLAGMHPDAGWDAVELVLTDAEGEPRVFRSSSAREGAARDEGAPGATHNTLVGQVLRTSRSAVVDPAADQGSGLTDVAEAARAGARTLACVPLNAQASTLGVLAMRSPKAGACSADVLAAVERVAAALATALDNGRLLRTLTERTGELEQANAQQTSLLRTVQALSSPVAPIAPGVIVMPIVGAMDFARSARFIEAMLDAVVARAAQIVLVDITGMVIVDEAAASYLVKAWRAARLLGAEVVLVGVRSAAARLLAAEDIHDAGLVTRASLALGFAYALTRVHGEIVRESAAAQ